MEGKSEPVEETQQASEATQPPAQSQGIEEKVVEVLRTVFDPEIPINIYELGLVYNVDVSPAADVVIRMTLTSPACPVAGTLPPEVENKVRSIPGVTSAKVDLVWDPPWSMENISEAAKLELGML
jgi:FeS assembly SUF system protein